MSLLSAAIISARGTMLFMAEATELSTFSISRLRARSWLNALVTASLRTMS